MTAIPYERLPGGNLLCSTLIFRRLSLSPHSLVRSLPVKLLQTGHWLPILKIGLAAIFLGSLGVYLKPGRLWEAWKQMDPGWIALAGLLALLGLGIQWVKWKQLLRHYRPQTTWGDGMHSLLIGFALGLVSPGRLGELGRGVFLVGDRATWVGAAGVDRLCSLAATLAAAWVGLWVIFPGAKPGLVLLLASLVILALAGAKAGTGSGDGWIHRVWKAVERAPGGVWARGLTWSILFNLVLFTQFYILVRSWGPVPGIALWGIPVIFGLKSILPISFMDLGVREGAAVLVLGMLEADPLAAFNSAILIFALNVLVPGACGSILVFRNIFKLNGVQSLPAQSKILSTTPWMTKG